MEIGKTKSTKIIIAWSPVYFIVLMLISYYNFHVADCNLFSVDISVSVNRNITGHSINTFDKNFNFSFYNSSRLSYMRLGNINKLMCGNSDNMTLKWCYN